MIQHKVNEIAERYHCSPNMKDFLEQTLSARADHTFLWVHVILQSLEETLMTSKRGFMDIVSQLPHELKYTYESILMAIPTGYEDKSSQLLNLILGSSR